MNLDDIRREIDAIDDELTKLFVRRMHAVDMVAQSKRSSGKAVLDPARENEVLARAASRVGPEFEDGVKQFFSTLMMISRNRQQERLSGSGELAQDDGSHAEG